MWKFGHCHFVTICKFTNFLILPKTVFSTSLHSVQLLSQVRLSATPWTTWSQASQPITNSWSLLKLMFTELVMPSSHLILCRPLLLLLSIFPSIRVFPRSQLFASYDHNIGASASASILPMAIQGWFPLELTGSIFLSKVFSRVFSRTTIQNH